MFEPSKELAVSEQPVIEKFSDADCLLWKKVFVTALLTAAEPLTVNALKRLSEQVLADRLVNELLAEIVRDFADSVIELNQVASGWRFRARPEMQIYLDRLEPQKAPRYSRAVLETLAIIAYHQPVTRGDIEEIRGVAVSTQIIKTLEARAWIEVIGLRDSPGKPALYATTAQLLNDLNLRSLKELPDLSEMGNLIQTQNHAGASGTSVSHSENSES